MEYRRILCARYRRTFVIIILNSNDRKPLRVDNDNRWRKRKLQTLKSSARGDWTMRVRLAVMFLRQLVGTIKANKLNFLKKKKI